MLPKKVEFVWCPDVLFFHNAGALGGFGILKHQEDADQMLFQSFTPEV